MNLKSGLLIVMSIFCLLGCAQEQVVVPGKREPISAVDSAAKLEDMSGFIKTGSKPFILAVGKANDTWSQSHGTPKTRIKTRL